MEKAYRRWVCLLLGGILAVLAAAAVVVYAVDPCLYYRLPQDGTAVFFNERTQMAGLVRHVPADTVLLGTSMAANYRGGEIGAYLGGTGLRITLPDGYFSEFDQVVRALFREQQPRRIVFGLDLNILVRDESGLSGAMPDYLYNDNPIDDIHYLLNKDSLYYSAYVLAAGGRQSIDEGFTWDRDRWWNHMTALSEYHRPEIAAQTVPAEAYLTQVQANLDVACRWVQEHPDTEFDFFLSPYSILFWDKTARLGQTDAMLTALSAAAERLTQLPNARLFAFLFDRELVENLDEYCDYIHHSGAVSTAVLQGIAAGEMELTAENWKETLANWREVVLHYDYDRFWDESFWARWNEAKAQGINPLTLLS